jgi:hypothetical protein
MATLRWVDWFNNLRLFGPIGYIPPAEAEANYYAAVEILDMAACLKPDSLQPGTLQLQPTRPPRLYVPV